jgi:predicted RNase H-like HicB family nuclease
MEELLFLVEEADEGGFIAKGLGEGIFTQADTYEELKLAVIDAVHCHFEDDKKRIIRLHIVKEEVIAA